MGTGSRGGRKRLLGALQEGQARLAEHVVALDRAAPLSVHQARVACRRLRALLKTFKPCFAETPARAYAQVLGRLATLLEAARELDVLASQPELQSAAFERAVAADRRVAVARLRRALRARSHHERWKLARRGPSAADLGLARHIEDRAVLKRVRRTWRRARRYLAAAATDSQARHALRIKLKNLRYTLEAVEDLAPGEAAQLRHSLRDAQQLLGDERDLIAAVAWLRRTSLPDTARRRAITSLERRRRLLVMRGRAKLARLAQAGVAWDEAVTRLVQAGP